MFWNVDIGAGVVEYDDISFLPEDFDAAHHADSLKEDMLQIVYPGDLVLDVGWYPSFNEGGRFTIMLVKDQDWEQPLERAHALDVISVKKIIARIASDIV